MLSERQQLVDRVRHLRRFSERAHEMIELAKAAPRLADEVERLTAALIEIATPEDHSKCTHDRDAEIARAALATTTE